MTASARQPPQAGAPFAEARWNLAILRSRIPCRAAIPAVRSAPRAERGGGRKPGQPVALSAFLEVSIRQPSFENHRSTAGPAAIIWPSQELSRFAEPTLCQIVPPRNTKKTHLCAETVDDVTSLWKFEEI